jgi:hypothetical protein
MKVDPLTGLSGLVQENDSTYYLLTTKKFFRLILKNNRPVELKELFNSLQTLREFNQTGRK